MNIVTNYGQYALYGAGALISGLSIYHAKERIAQNGVNTGATYSAKSHNIVESIAAIQAGVLKEGLHGALDGVIMGLLILSTPITLLAGATSVTARVAKQRFMPASPPPSDNPIS
ncbi:MAG: hypothetical protein CMO81_10620 [Waddliaceae bacterium]|nr:hypothetical protein [Waddliaceae bacterium]